MTARIMLKQYAIVCGQTPVSRPWVTALLVLVTAMSFMYVVFDPPRGRQLFQQFVQCVGQQCALVLKRCKQAWCQARKRKRKNSY